jgi:GxxExxY protein
MKQINTDKKLMYANLTYKIRGAIFNVYNTLGPGHKEQVYQKALAKELKETGIPYKREEPLEVSYKGEKVGNYRPDFVVKNKVILEIKAVEFMPKFYEQQLVHYLKSTNFKIGFLVNFGAPKLVIKRLIWTNPCKSALNLCKSIPNTRKSKTALFTIILALFLLLTTAWLKPIFSQSFSLSLSPPVVEVMMQPGRKATYAFQLKNNSSSPVNLLPKIIPFQPQGEQGQVKYPPENGNWPGQDYFSFLNADLQINQPFLLAPDEEIQLVLKISLPQNAPEGDYYQSLILEQLTANTPNQTQAQLVGQIGSHILLTVSSSGKPKKEAAIVEFFSPSLLFGKILDSFDALNFELRIKNTGQAFFKPFGEIIILNNNEEKIASLPLRPDNILKDTTRQIYCQEGPCRADKLNFLGRYQAQVQFTADENGPVSKQSFIFWVLPIKLTLGLVLGLLLAIFIWWGYRKRK